MNFYTSLAIIAFLFMFTTAQAQKAYTAYKQVPCAGNGGWDYLSIDAESRKLYVSHGNKVEVIDIDKDERISEIQAGTSVHGIAIAKAENKGFISNSKSNDITVFDLKTNEILKTIPSTGTGVDAINYDAFTHLVLVHNSKTKSITVIDAATSEVKGTVENLGKLESGATDGKGFYYVNLEKENAIAKVDLKTMKLTTTFPLAPDASPAGLGIDVKNHLLFCGARSNNLVVVDFETGKIIATVPISDHNDAVVFDPETRLIYAPGLQADMTIIKQESKNKYTVVQHLVTKFLSKTMALDPKTKKVYLPGADYDGTDEKKSVMLPDSFKVLVFKN